MLKDKESGQSIIIIAAIVVVLLALVALVVDVGNAYAHRRMVQNAVDAGALAGARRLADRYIGEFVREKDVFDEIKTFAQENGLDPDVVKAWFIDSEGDNVKPIDPNGKWVPPGSAEGVKVAGDLPFTTYFAHLLGFPRMTASTTANAWVLAGPCSAENLFPVIVSSDTFTDTETPGIPDLHEVYTLWDKNKKAAPGNFGWIYWEDGDGKNHCPVDDPAECPQGPQVTVLGPNISENWRSGSWAIGDWIHGDVGVNMQPALDELAPYFEGDPQPVVYLPLFDEVKHTGNNALYHIYAFAGFRLRCAFSSKNHFIERVAGDCAPCDTGSSNRKCIRGEFVEMVVGSGQDGCNDTGVYIPSFRKPR